MKTVFFDIILTLYFSATLGLLLYGINCYILITLFKRKVRIVKDERSSFIEAFGNPMNRQDLPHVTTQIPVFNEYNVIERALVSACKMTYPTDKHEIQVLDDSSDETRELIDNIVINLKNEGHDIKVIRRDSRLGFKAGALMKGMETAKGSLFTVFDADFVPTKDYLLQTVPFFMRNKNLGLVQARWGHLNRNESLLTKAQSIGIDGHFAIEQAARDYNGLFMNFNGTAGIWRKEAINAGGGWQWDTLTEDMDLSYRVQFKGWETVYLPDVVVPAELPENINSFKSQQFRWAKGSIQTALKLLPALIKSDVSIFKKLQAYFHLTHYLVHPMMLTLAFLALPVLHILELNIGPIIFSFMALLLTLSMFAPSTLYLVSQKSLYKDWYKKILFLPALVIIGVGIAISNTRAILEAFMGKESAFIRTPKKGEKEMKRYRIHFPVLACFEIMFGAYCGYSFHYYIQSGKYLVGPFLAIYSAGFLFIGILTLLHSLDLKSTVNFIFKKRLA